MSPYQPNAPTKHGYPIDEVISSLQKAVRRSDVEAAVFWTVELDESDNAGWCWNRLRIMASEDIGLAEPTVAATVYALYMNWKEFKAKKNANKPERLFLIHAAMLLAGSKKSRAVDNALIVHNFGPKELRPIPDEGADKHTVRGRKLGRSFRHFAEQGTVLIQPGPFVDPFEDRARELLLARDGQPGPKDPPENLLSSIARDGLAGDYDDGEEPI